MDDAVLISLLEKQHNDLKDYIDLTGKATRGKIISEVDRVDQMNVIRNGRIGKNEDDIDEMEDDTRLFRRMHRNPGLSIIIGIIIIAFIALGAYQINVKRTIEKATPIEFKENE